MAHGSDKETNFSGNTVQLAGEDQYDPLAEKAPLADDDLIMIEDSEDGFSKKKVKVVTLESTTPDEVIRTDTADQYSGLTEKADPDDDDLLILEDSAAAGAKKKVKISAVAAEGGGGSGVTQILTPAQLVGDLIHGAFIIRPGNGYTLGGQLNITDGTTTRTYTYVEKIVDQASDTDIAAWDNTDGDLAAHIAIRINNDPGNDFVTAIPAYMHIEEVGAGSRGVQPAIILVQRDAALNKTLRVWADANFDGEYIDCSSGYDNKSLCLTMGTSDPGTASMCGPSTPEADTYEGLLVNSVQDGRLYKLAFDRQDEYSWQPSTGANSVGTPNGATRAAVLIKEQLPQDGTGRVDHAMLLALENQAPPVGEAIGVGTTSGFSTEYTVVADRASESAETDVSREGNDIEAFLERLAGKINADSGNQTVFAKFFNGADYDGGKAPFSSFMRLVPNSQVVLYSADRVYAWWSTLQVDPDMSDVQIAQFHFGAPALNEPEYDYQYDPVFGGGGDYPLTSPATPLEEPNYGMGGFNGPTFPGVLAEYYIVESGNKWTYTGSEDGNIDSFAQTGGLPEHTHSGVEQAPVLSTTQLPFGEGGKIIGAGTMSFLGVSDNATDGDTFYCAKGGVNEPYVFKTTPGAQNHIQIGSSGAVSLSNAAEGVNGESAIFDAEYQPANLKGIFDAQGVIVFTEKSIDTVPTDARVYQDAGNADPSILVYVKYQDGEAGATWTNIQTRANAIRSTYATHAADTDPHFDTADTGNAPTAPVATDVGTTIALLNDLKSKFNAHIDRNNGIDAAAAIINDFKTAWNNHVADPTTVHNADSGDRPITSSPPTTADTGADFVDKSAQITQEIYALYIDHLADTSAHVLADGANGLVDNRVSSLGPLAARPETYFNPVDVSDPAPASDITGSTVYKLYDFVLDLHTKYAAHLLQGTWHKAQDATNVITLNQLGIDESHLAASVNTITAADAADSATAATLANELSTSVDSHVDPSSNIAASPTFSGEGHLRNSTGSVDTTPINSSIIGSVVYDYDRETIEQLEESDPAYGRFGLNRLSTGGTSRELRRALDTDRRYYLDTDQDTWKDDTSPSTTSKSMHVYVDADNGDANNSGLTPASPKQSITEAAALLPHTLLHTCVVHLKGDFDSGCVVSNWIAPDALLLIDGGDNYTQLDGPRAMSAAHTLRTVGTTGAGWTVDEFAGKICRIIDGSAAGSMSMIRSNTAEVLTFCADLDNDPDTADTYEIIEPATSLGGTGQTYAVNCSGGGTMFFQRLKVTDSGALLPQGNEIGTSLSQIISDSDSPFAIAAFGSRIETNMDGVDPATSDFSSFTDGRKVGISERSAAGQLISVSRGGSIGNIDCSVLDGLALNHCVAVGKIGNGSRIMGQITLYDFIGRNRLNPADESFIQNGSSGFEPTTIEDSAGPGILAIDSDLVIGEGVVIQNNTTHGVEADGSRVDLIGDVEGTGNGGAGVYAHDHSNVRITDGNPPTLTGTVGDASVDGAAEVETWTNIDAGTKVSSAEEMTTIREQ